MMAIEKRKPWGKWYWGDWRKDIQLRMCGYAARGLWADLLSLMAESERHGYLLVKGAPPTAKQLAGLLGGAEREIVKLLAELGDAGVYSVVGGDIAVDLVDIVDQALPKGTIYSRRMLRDKAKAEVNRANGEQPDAGNPSIRRGSVPKGERVRPFKRSDAPAKTRRIFERDGGHCHWCDKPLDVNAFHVDHVIAICDGGTNDEDNLVAACADCNGRRALEERPAMVRHQYRVGVGPLSDTNSDTGKNDSDHNRGSPSDHKAQRLEARSQKPESSAAEVHLDAARVGAGVTEDDLARAIILAFDDQRVVVFGEENQRAWPRQTDLDHARRMRKAGADGELCAAVFRDRFERQKAKGKRPADSLEYMIEAVLEAVRERDLHIPGFLDRRPKGNGAGGGEGVAERAAATAYDVILEAWNRGRAAKRIPLALPAYEDYRGPATAAWIAAVRGWEQAGWPGPMPRLDQPAERAAS